ncbi:LicD family protein [Thomasclavelia cocleata]|uniref:LicD family protein n=1 Tax=Thomasclavelia cocleata TaxID=69824 RepID=UPI00249424E9|nr:LicD family protein [Thomasclavelia cocleata]
MNNKDLVKLQNTQYEMLVEIVRICKKYKIRYYLAYGTLLGAVRHSGTIPWDYDIDIFMDRNDYNKFIKVSGEMSNIYEIGYVGSGENSMSGLARVYKKNTLVYTENHDQKGAFPIHVDIFILDYKKEYPKLIEFIVNSLVGYLSVAKLSHYEKEWLYEHFKNNRIKKIVIKSGNIFRMIFGEGKIERFIYGILVNKNGSDNYITITNHKKTLPCQWFREGRVMKYEDGLYMVPIEYDKLLSLWYGDYMILPPIEKRFTLEMEKFKIRWTGND